MNHGKWDRRHEICFRDDTAITLWHPLTRNGCYTGDILATNLKIHFLRTLHSETFLQRSKQIKRSVKGIF